MFLVVKLLCAARKTNECSNANDFRRRLERNNIFVHKRSDHVFVKDLSKEQKSSIIVLDDMQSNLAYRF